MSEPILSNLLREIAELVPESDEMFVATLTRLEANAERHADLAPVIRHALAAEAETYVAGLWGLDDESDQKLRKITNALTQLREAGVREAHGAAQPLPQRGLARIDVGRSRVLLVAGSGEAIDVVREMMRVYRDIIAGKHFGVTPDGCVVEIGGPAAVGGPCSLAGIRAHLQVHHDPEGVSAHVWLGEEIEICVAGSLPHFDESGRHNDEELLTIAAVHLFVLGWRADMPHQRARQMLTSDAGLARTGYLRSGRRLKAEGAHG